MERCYIIGYRSKQIAEKAIIENQEVNSQSYFVKNINCIQELHAAAFTLVMSQIEKQNVRKQNIFNK